MKFDKRVFRVVSLQVLSTDNQKPIPTKQFTVSTIRLDVTPFYFTKSQNKTIEICFLII